MRRIFSLAFALVVGFSTAARAQSPTSSTTRQLALTIQPFLSCAGTKDIDFGPHRTTDGTIFTSATNYAEVTCTTDPGNSLNVSFGLPTSMINDQATSFPLPITYGTSAGYVSDNSSQFNPASGIAGDITNTGNITVRLGWPRTASGPDELVAVNVSTAKRGTYHATVTFTVAVN